MKSTIVKYIITLSAIVLSLVPLLSQAATDADSINYLKNQTPNEWITLALVAGGETSVAKDYLKTFTGSSATDYAKRILAIGAAGENPRSFATTDLVAGLKNKVESGQIGNIDWLNDDAWGILALRAAGEDINSTAVAGAKNYLLNNQQPDGGWGWQVGGASDTNDTAAVLMALGEAGLDYHNSAVQKGFSYLRANQQPDGGFPYDTAWPISDSASTAWVVSALNKFNQAAAGWTQGSVTPVDFLRTLQLDDGSYKWQANDMSGSAIMAAYAVIALTGSSYPVRPRGLFSASGRPSTMVDIKLSIELNAVEFRAGDLVDLQVHLINLGPGNAQEVNVIDVLPAPVQDVRASLSQGYWQPDKNQWSLGGLPKDGRAEIKFSFSANQPTEAAVWSSLVRAITPSNDEFNQTDNQVNYSFTVFPRLDTEREVETPLSSADAAAINSLEAEAAPKVLGISDERCGAAVYRQLPQSDLIDVWRGRFLQAASSQLVYYLAASGKQIYCLDSDQAVQQLLALSSLGITQSNLDKIPEPGEDWRDNKFSLLLAKDLAGQILLNVDGGGAAWYVDKVSGQRTYLGVFGYAREIMRSLAVTIDNKVLVDLTIVPFPANAAQYSTTTP